MKKPRFVAALIVASTLALTSLTPAASVMAASPTVSTEIRGTPVTKIKALVNLNIRSGPGTGYHRTGMLHAGEVRAVIGVSDNYQWWKVWCTDGTGWVSASALYSRPVAWRH